MVKPHKTVDYAEAAGLLFVLHVNESHEKSGSEVCLGLLSLHSSSLAMSNAAAEDC